MSNREGVPLVRKILRFGLRGRRLGNKGAGAPHSTARDGCTARPDTDAADDDVPGPAARGPRDWLGALAAAQISNTDTAAIGARRKVFWSYREKQEVQTFYK